MDRFEKKIGCLMVFIWALGIGWWGFVAWAIYRLVTHFT